MAESVREPAPTAQMPSRGSAAEVFRVFGKLGLTSFGGPVAHLGYFRAELVERRKWLSERQYADLVALSQFLPGPASSQVGFGLGMYRAGFWGALAAFVAFTLPSAVALVLFAYGASFFTGPIGEGVLAGLKIVAVAIVAQAVWGMAKSLTPDRQRASIAVVAAAVVLLWAGVGGQVVAIVVGGLAGLAFLRGGTDEKSPALLFPVSKTVGVVSLVVFAVLLVLVFVLEGVRGSGNLAVFGTFFRAGSLVFGGGHVVLPLLQAGTADAGWVTYEQFLAGYGAAQAVPGPLFTFAAYLGAVSSAGSGGVVGALVGLLAIFLPGFLLLVGVLPFWNSVREYPKVHALMRGANAAVVGILLAALYDPVFTTAITGPGAFVLAIVGFLLLVQWRLAPWMVVALSALGGVALQFLPF
ncbi:MAG: chromate efflux transporter [Actinomycetaceae bacterium]|nr:chromate efflux transporter [Actinomycetaceae bacterium]